MVVVAVFVMTLVDVGGCVGAKVVSVVVLMAPERDVMRGAVEPDGSVVKESHHRVHEVVHGVSEAGSDVADDLLLGLDQRRDNTRSTDGGTAAGLWDRGNDSNVDDLPDEDWHVFDPYGVRRHGNHTFLGLGVLVLMLVTKNDSFMAEVVR